MREETPAGAAGNGDGGNGDGGNRPTFGGELDRIRLKSRTEAEKGRWFERLFMKLVLQEPEFDIENIWTWADWPDRERLTGAGGQDLGIDLVARDRGGQPIAIQCKCYDPKHKVSRAEINKFLVESDAVHPETGGNLFARRWLVATSPWTDAADKAVQRRRVPAEAIDFMRHARTPVLDEGETHPSRELWPEQEDAIAGIRRRLDEDDRCRLIMACGTGKTFTSLRAAEELVPDGGRILFAVPSIALAAGARAEWLLNTRRRLKAVVVCSDRTAGGDGDIASHEMIGEVTSSPERIAEVLSGPGPTRIVFSTYHSLDKVAAAQTEHGAPAFDLAFADEAHRTTGVSRTKGAGRREGAMDFQLIHDPDRLKARKRVYMTATPRVYDESSKTSLRGRGYEVADMDDEEIYGPLAYRLGFREAREVERLAEYRVIVLALEGDGVIGSEMRRTLEAMGRDAGARIGPMEFARLEGVLLALNGRARAGDGRRGPILHRTLAFANTRARSRWYADAFAYDRLQAAVTGRIRDEDGEGRALNVTATHLEAKHSARERRRELERLDDAAEDGECRIVTNVRLFTEGVDVPALNAVIFLDARDSQIDIVQAVGRVMRKDPKDPDKVGYIIVPVMLQPDPDADADIADRLAREGGDHSAIGRVLKALQSHDGRLAENPARFIDVYGPPGNPPVDGTGEADSPWGATGEFALERVNDEKVIARICAGRLPSAAKLAGDGIEDAVKDAARAFKAAELEGELAAALGLDGDGDGKADAAGVDKIAALMLINACMLQERLRAVPDLAAIPALGGIPGGEGNPAAWLLEVWGDILKRDYKPVFEPAARAAAALEDACEGEIGKPVRAAIRRLVERAGNVADSLSEMGLDHAGPLYHRILGTAKSDGAFYTNNVSAVLLSRLALTEDMVDWSDPDAPGRLRIMDPACGTGTLLMAAIHAIKARVAAARGEAAAKDDSLHKALVENAVCGLDINPHAVQLAACNLTLGAPTVDYQRMNLVTMPHGPRGDKARAGSLEILIAADDAELASMTAPERKISALDGKQVDAAEDIQFPLAELDVVIMNPPFSDNKKRGRKFSDEANAAMRDREREIKARLAARDPAAAEVPTSNTISTFFTPLADRLLGPAGTLAKVIPVTGCTGADGLAERQFLSERFHIERVVTSHDPKRVAFSGATDIHECLLIARRHVGGGGGGAGGSPAHSTEFVSLRRMPENPQEAATWADSIAAGSVDKFGAVCRWPAERVRGGDWSPAQWCDPGLAGILLGLEMRSGLVRADEILTFGAAGQAVRGVLRKLKKDEAHVDAIMIFDSVSVNKRRTMSGVPQESRVPINLKPRRIDLVLSTKGHLMLSNRHRTTNGLVTALHSKEASVGSGWMPATGKSRDAEKGICSWWNSTPGRLLLLNRRSMTLDYIKWSVSHLKSVPVPAVDRLAPLIAAWETHKNDELLPLRDGESCPVRKALDVAAAAALEEDPAVVADWRRRLAAEPTVTGTAAPDPVGDDDPT